MKIVIRPEQAADIPAIYAVHAAAFGQENESKLVNLLRQSEHFIPGLSLAGVTDSGIVGHILFSKIKIVAEDGRVTESLALAPVAVVPDLQYAGIGSQLVRRGLEAARELGYTSVIVLGHAQYYPKFGFAPASRWGITTSYEVPDDTFMAIELIPGGLAGVSGRVMYPKEFEEV